MHLVHWKPIYIKPNQQKKGINKKTGQVKSITVIVI